MTVTLRDVAHEAGVSIKTVSNVINNHPYVKSGTRATVLDAIQRLGYRPNLSARNLRSGRSNMIGLAVPELSLSYFAELADKVIQAAERRGLVVLIEQTNRSRQREIDLLSGVRPSMIDGLLFSPLELGQEDRHLVDIDLPLVLLGERIFNSGADHVTMQNVRGARAATDHLLSIGRRRIAVIGAHPGEVIGTAGLRLSGYRGSLDAAGIPFDSALVAPAGLWHRAQGAEAMRTLIASGTEFDSVFAFNDTLALGALYVLQEAGLRVPTDVAVIGWDAIDEGSYSSPSLTSVDPGREEIAETAVNMLIERIATKGGGPPPREVEVDFSIVHRDSTRVDRHVSSDELPG
jgi:DNA-binding LacI/PurR family transcriptional regulator